MNGDVAVPSPGNSDAKSAREYTPLESSREPLLPPDSYVLSEPASAANGLVSCPPMQILIAHDENGFVQVRIPGTHKKREITADSYEQTVPDVDEWSSRIRFSRPDQKHR